METRIAMLLLALLVVGLAVMCWLLVLAGTAAMIPILLVMAAVPAWSLANVPNQPRGDR